MSSLEIGIPGARRVERARRPYVPIEIHSDGSSEAILGYSYWTVEEALALAAGVIAARIEWRELGA